MSSCEEYKSRGECNRYNNRKYKNNDAAQRKWGVIIRKSDEYTLKTPNYNHLRCHTRSKLQNKNNWEDFEMPSMYHSKYIRLENICPCCKSFFIKHKIFL